VAIERRRRVIVFAVEGEFLAAQDEIRDQINDHRDQLLVIGELLAGLAAGESEEFLM